MQNYPNPASGETTIAFTLAEKTNISLSIYSITGELIEEVISGLYESGRHTITYNTGGLSASSYIYRLKTNKTVTSKTMQVL
ncbi:MAG: T9SS type A sorting domain-containing protein [Bacteroidota bacterium]